MRKTRSKHSAYGNPFLDFSTLRYGDKVFVVCRVSARQQNRTRNLARQKKRMMRVVSRKVGASNVLGIFCRICSGQEVEWLEEIFALAREKGAKVIFHDQTRAIRPLEYHSVNNPLAMAGIREFELIRELANGVPLVLFISSEDASDIRSFHAKQKGKIKMCKEEEIVKGPGYEAICDKMEVERFAGTESQFLLREVGIKINQLPKEDCRDSDLLKKGEPPLPLDED